MGLRVPSSLHEHFAVLTAPRCPHAPTSRPLLMDILIIAVCAVSSGAEGWEDSEEDGEANAAWLGDRLDLPHGIPGHDTFRRVLSQLAPEELPQGCIAWTQALSEASGGERVSSAGPTRRHACAQATATAAIPMVRAWASANRLVLGPRQGAAQSHAMPAMPTLLLLLARTGAVGTLDAMGCQKASAQTMTEPGADDVLALKDHPPTRSAAVPLFLHEARDTGLTDLAHADHATVAGDHGRLETRRAWITSAIASLDAKGSWSNWHSVGMGAARRAVGDTVQGETRYFLTALPAQGVRFAQAVRQPWGIETALPGVLAVSFEEDACRMRQDKGAPTFAVLRHMALHLLRREPPQKRGIKARRKRAGWDRDYLVQGLTG
jgi:predicted transposase YbfD/YdcC